MKKIMALFFLLLPLSLFGKGLSLGLDLRGIDVFWSDGARFDVEAGFDAYDVKLIFPIRYGKTFDNHVNYLESGCLVEVEPFSGIPFFIRASLLKVGWIWGLLAPEEQLYFSAEGTVGYRVRFGCFYLKPMLTFRESLTADAKSTEVIQEIKQFSELRASLVVGMAF